jgi:aerobic-type carbon monoxide dehydrogenase small subunit (CoxS/CutS family)
MEVNALKQLAELKVNGKVHSLMLEPNRTLLDVLREDLGLTGAKKACDGGTCGSCSILLDGKAVAASCLMLAIEAQGKDIITIEGLAVDGKLHPLQEAFIEHYAFQCGFCTPGMILAAKALLDENPSPTEEEVREAISGNLCRCTGYVNIVDAVLAAAETMRNQSR